MGTTSQCFPSHYQIENRKLVESSEKGKGYKLEIGNGHRITHYKAILTSTSLVFRESVLELLEPEEIQSIENVI